MEKRRSYDCIKVELDETEIEDMTMEQKLNTLLKIAFSNHQQLLAHDEIFYGNGKKGIIPTIESHSWMLRGMCIAITVGATVIGFIISQLTK